MIADAKLVGKVLMVARAVFSQEFVPNQVDTGRMLLPSQQSRSRLQAFRHEGIPLEIVEAAIESSN
jgi:hypothetical protein